MSPDGRRVTLLNMSAIVPVACARKSRTLGLWPATGSARIRHDGAFRTDLRATRIADAAGTTVTVTGRFLSRGRARGTLRWRGQGKYRGCNVEGTWTAHAWPPLPPVQHFRGTTTNGARVTFDRTIESHPRVLRFKFGSLRATNHDSGCTSVPPTASPAFGPPWDVFMLLVKQRRFSGAYMGVDEAYVVNVTGQFDAKVRVSGTVSYADRVDCSSGVVRWSAHRTG